MEEKHNNAVSKVEKIMEKNNPNKKFHTQSQIQAEQKSDERIRRREIT